VNLDIRRLTGEAGRRLVDHDARVGERRTLALRSGGEQKRAHTRRLTDAERRHIGFNILHGIIDGKSRGHHATRRIDVEVNVLLRILRLQEEQLRDHQARDMVIDSLAQEDDAVFEKARKYVIGPFAPRSLFNDEGYKAHAVPRKMGCPENGDLGHNRQPCRY
jgi:hypothetical protein